MRRACIVLLLSAGALPGSALAGSCPFNGRPLTSDPHDLGNNGILLGTTPAQNLHIYNVYLSGHWDKIPGNPSKEQIDLATQAVIAAGYFDRTCQYGTPTVYWKGSGTSDNLWNIPCGALNDPPSGGIDLSNVLHYFACQEAIGGFGTPAVGVPDSTNCGGCDLTGGFDCFLDGACDATPNPTGDTIYNIFIPANSFLFELPVGSRALSFHWQIPSNRFSAIPGVAGTGVVGTAGRPLYVAFIPIANNPTLDDVMKVLTHEDVEAATDPFPSSSWQNNNDVNTEATCPSTPKFGCGAGHGEAADICQDYFTETFTFTPPPKIGSLDLTGLPAFNVARYWSNDGHSCPVPFVSPSTTAILLPPANANGWNRTSVEVVMTASEPGGVGGLTVSASATGAQPIAPVTSSDDTLSLGITKEGATLVSFFATDAAGLAEAPPKQQAVNIDETPPVIASVGRFPAPNPFGWNNTEVDVSFVCSDALSGIASCQSTVAMTNEGMDQVATGTAVDKADNNASASLGNINIDKTPPVIGIFAPGEVNGAYTIDQQVNITCSASDALSGVLTTSCSNGGLSGPAYQFYPAGAFAAAATDRAGNKSQSTIAFKVIVTYGSLENLAKEFACRPGVGNALANKLANAQAAPDVMTRDNILDAFINQVEALTGKCISNEGASLLIMFASVLK